MTNDEMILKINCLITQISLLNNVNFDISDVLYTLIDQCKNEICSYLNTVYDVKYDYVCIDMVVCRYNRLGSEGMASQNYSGSSETYLTEYPDYVMRQLNSFKKKWGAL